MYIDGYEDVYIRKMVDGVDVGEVVNNWSMLNSYPQEMIDQVEVIKGGSSSVWGSNMGGIINVDHQAAPRTWTGPSSPSRARIRSYGAMDFTGANAIGIKGDNLDYSANILGNVKKFGYIVRLRRRPGTTGSCSTAREKNYNIFGKFSYDFSDNTYLDFLYNRNKMDTQTRRTCICRTCSGPTFPITGITRPIIRRTLDVASLKFVDQRHPDAQPRSPAQVQQDGLQRHRRNTSPGPCFQPPAGTIEHQNFIDQKTGFTVKGSYRPPRQFSLVSGVDLLPDQGRFHGLHRQPAHHLREHRGPLRQRGIPDRETSASTLGARYDHDSSFGNQLSPSVGATFNFVKASLFRVNVARTFKVPAPVVHAGRLLLRQILPNPRPQAGTGLGVQRGVRIPGASLPLRQSCPAITTA